MAQTILVADDSATMRRIVEMALKGSHYNVVAVESGEQALQAVYQHRPALVILDYHLPDRSGIEVCRSLKTDPSLRSTPVLIMGGSFHGFDEAQARSNGCDDIITKPFKTDPFTEKVQALVRSGASAGAISQEAAPAPLPQPPASPARSINPPAPTAPAMSMPSGLPGARNAPKPIGNNFPPRGTQRLGSIPSPLNPPPASAGRPRFAPNDPNTTVGPMSTPSPRGRFATRTPASNPTASNRMASPASMRQTAPSSPSGSTPRVGSPSGSTPRIGSTSGSNPRAAAPQPSRAPAPAPTPAAQPSTMRQSAPTVSGNLSVLQQAGMSQEELQAMVREEVQKAVREQMLGMVRSVLGDLFQEKLMPRLMKHGEDRIQSVVSNDLRRLMQKRVDEEMTRLVNNE